MKTKCPWCLDPQSEIEEGLCTMHEAELLGVSYEQLQRMDQDELG